MRVIMFAKAPRPGFVKTRLARDIGAAAAANAYRDVGSRVANQVATAFPLTVWYTPAGAADEMRMWLGDLDYREQVGRDLGERMAHAFAVHFAAGEDPVIAIGADAPGVTQEILRDAARSLEASDVALGPAMDGGYYLLGLRRLVPLLFHDVPWGTSRVLEVTVSRCRTADIAVAMLPPLRDLDTVADLDALGEPS